MSRRQKPHIVALVLAAAVSSAVHAQVVNSEWNTGSGNWNVTTNWLPNDVPDNGGTFTYNVFIGNRPVALGAAVTFLPEDGTSDTISSLVISNAADLFTNGFQVLVVGQTTLDGGGSTIRIDPHTTPSVYSFDTDNLDINNGASLVMNGGIVNVDVLLEINTSFLSGFGTVEVGDADAIAETVFENSGTIQVGSSSLAPQVLTLQALGIDLLDLDGTADTGTIDVANVLANVNADTLTLVVNTGLSDSFSRLLSIGQRDTVTLNTNFAFNGGTLSMAGGTAVATLNGTGTINSLINTAIVVTGHGVINNNMTFSGTGNTITVGTGGTLTLNGNVTIPDASALALSGTGHLIIGGNTVINEGTGDFDWDGLAGTTVTTVNGSGFFQIIANHVDLAGDTFNATLNMNDGGDVQVSVSGASWTMAGILNKNNVGTSAFLGDQVNVTGTVNVNAGLLQFNPAMTASSGSIFNIGPVGFMATSTATLSPGSVFHVNGTLSLGVLSTLAGPTTIDGTGLFRIGSSSIVSANTTINTSSFDWDGTGSGTIHTLNDGVIFTINSTVWDSDDAGDVDDPINLGGNGAQIIVNNIANWTMANTLNANTAGAGLATIGGTARFTLSGSLAVLNVDGNTTISAPVTLGPLSSVSIDAARTLTLGSSAIYNGTFISGPGRFNPASSSVVSGNSAISSTLFDFDGALWTIQGNALLTINVSDYDPGTINKAFNSTITLNSSDITVNTGDAEFVLAGTLNMNSNIALLVTTWSGEPLDIGNDTGTLDTHLNVAGNQLSRITAQADINSDADIHIGVGASLEFTNTVNFESFNAGNMAGITGDGTLLFSGAVNIVEGTIINMVGGTVDLDGTDTVGDTLNIDAGFSIKADFLNDFGRVNAGGGVNTLNVDSATIGHSGSLNVTLDAGGTFWTLGAQGVMNLLNSSLTSVLLSGNRVQIDGTLNVSGSVRTLAPITLGASGVINLNTAGQTFFLNGAFGNYLRGGTINGPGVLGADTGILVSGFGTIAANIDFDGTADLSASEGTLTITGSIIDVNILSVSSNGVLNVVNPWNSSGVGFIRMFGGTITGGLLTLNNTGGIDGYGLLSAPLVNNAIIENATGTTTLIVETPGNNNDWDGAASAGRLQAVAGTLELRDNAGFTFGGTVTALGGGTVFTNNFGFNFTAASRLNLTGGIFRSTNTTDFNGQITVNAGSDSTIDVQDNRFLDINATAAVTLNSNLVLKNNNINIKAGATFSGSGALVVPAGSHAVMDANANVNVLLIMNGALRPAGSEGVGRIDVRDYQQGATGALFSEITGTNLNQFDRIFVNGAAQVGGYLNIDIDGGFVPVLGQTFDILTATGGVTGSFLYMENSGMPAGLGLDFTILPNAVRISLVNRKFWTNAAGTGLWATDNNWSGNLKPTASELVGFPFGVQTITLTGVESVLGMEIDDAHTFNGGTITLSGRHPVLVPFPLNSHPIINSALVVNGALVVTGQGSLSINPSLLTATGVNVIAGSTVKLLGTNTALKAPFTLAGAWTSRLDIQASSVVVDTVNPADKTARIAELQSQITSGKAGGTWNGNGITSSTVAADAAHLTVALVDNADLHLTTFRGVSVDDSFLIVAAARFGDATIDGKVNALDLNLLAAHWNSATGNLWSDGDFSGDGAVNAFDLNLLASNWQFGTGGSLVSFEEALAVFPELSSATVPEPASLLLLGFASTGLLLRRRR